MLNNVTLRITGDQIPNLILKAAEHFLFLSQSALCTWNTDRRSIDPNKPDASIDLSVSNLCAQKEILYNEEYQLHVL